MGGITIEVQGEGPTMKDAFLTLKKEALEEYGSDESNGTISTIDYWQDKTPAFKASGLALEEYFDGVLMDVGTGEALGVCLREPVGEKPGLYAFAGWAHE
jgi:hypothetical protein